MKASGKLVPVWRAGVHSHFAVGLALHRAGRLAEAEVAYRQAVALQPTDARALANLGGILATQGKIQEAIATERLAIAADPNLAEAYYNLGTIIRDRNLAEAIAAFRQAIALKPDYADAYSNLAMLLTAQGKNHEAIAACRQAIAIRPAHSGAYNNLGRALAQQGRIDEAVNALREALRHELSPEIYSGLLLTLLYDHRLTPKELFEEHKKWGELFGKREPDQNQP